MTTLESTSQITAQLEKIALKIKSGVTYLDLKGETINFDGITQKFDNGYLVSRKAPSIILDLQKFKDLHYSELTELLKNLYFKATSFDYLGYWIDSDKIYIDLSFRIENKSQAINQGLVNDQKAIWDCKNQESIFIEKYSF
jgi:hypothetical protein